MTASAFKELRKRPGVMLAYFVLRRTLRNTPQFRGAVAGILVVIVDKEWIGRFHRAGELLLSGQRQAFFNAEASRHQVVSIETGAKKRVDLDVLRALAQTIVITDSFDALSEKVRMAADEILYVDNPTVRHVHAVRTLTGRSRVDGEVARKLVNESWSVIDALLCRRSLDHLVIGTTTHSKDLPPTGARLSELPGFPSVRTWASELATDLAAWRGGKLAWSDVDRAALLIGPPGVGKTMCAGALAAELGLPLVSTSAGQWQSAGGGYLGDMLSAMRSSFKEAAASKSGALLFIDELDSIGNRSHQSNHAYYETQVVNTFLELTSKETPGVVLLAATNRLDDIEQAILRSGRFERHVYVDLPTREERAEILSYHLGGFDADRLRRWTDQLREFSPADLERIGRAIKRSARAAGREVEDDDVENGMPPKATVSDEVRRRIAIHECGHAVVALSCDFIDAVTVELSDTVFEGRVMQSGGQVRYDMRDRILPTEDVLRAQIRISLAGLAAEEVEIGSKSTGAGGHPGSDLDTATEIAKLMVASWGMGRVPRFYADRQRVDQFFRAPGNVTKEVDGILLEEWEKVKAMLLERRETLLRLTSDLMNGRRIHLHSRHAAT
ncbi:DNA polymerase III delta prime subunit [Rhizobium leguminosarum]|uniref:AAA family ATPase n=1 Tax=Rhizobium leguminosarum TaxID=384 RepID=UPI001EC59428|nr:AAA family ATPase [Rhizobium leguminosarum]MBP2489140.1 DNA polymerase III delta prime subunit [Rhizobium leguminosarum]